MAKTKTPKTDKIVDLKPKAEKITDVQLNRLQSTVKTIDHLVADIGQMELRKFSLMKAMDTVQNDLEVLRKEFQDNYGTDHINIQTGEITYQPDNHNPEENGKTNKKD